MTAWRMNEAARAVLAGCVLFFYIVIGVAELWPGIGAVMFILPPLAYVNLAMMDELTAVDSKRKRTAVDELTAVNKAGELRFRIARLRAIP